MIFQKLKDPVVRVQLCVISAWSQSLTAFLTLLGKEVPLIHILHDQLNELVGTLMRRFLKANEVGENKQVATCSRYLQVREPVA